MCFSATASFVAGAVLIPAGAFAVAQAWKTDHRYLVLATFPALFGVQQLFEGRIWLSLEHGTEGASHAAALAFLFFAYLLWLVLTPLAAYFVEERSGRRWAFLAVVVLGAAYGLSLFAPLLILPEWLAVDIVRGSIVYDTRLIYDDAVSNTSLRLVYAAVICMPLLASSEARVRVFGVLITLSVLVSFLFATYAFTSIWCYLAAVVSAYVLFMMYKLPRRTAEPSGERAAGLVK